MLQSLKLTAPDHEIAFVSDLHWGHDRDFIWDKRGFSSVKESDETLVQRWNTICTTQSHVWHLGDIVFADPDGSRFMTLMRRLNFKVLYHLWGNHNSGGKAIYNEALQIQYPDAALRGAEVYPLTICVDGDPQKQIVFLPTYLEANINGQRITLCHYPIISHHKAGHGSIMLAGHSHGSCAITNKDTGIGKRLDLGIESFGRPITFDELKKFMDKRPVHSYDHHSSSTT